MFKSFRYRIYPTAAQGELFSRYFSACRYVYNIALETKIYAYRAHGVTLSEYDLVKQLQDAKKDFAWLREFSAQTLNAEIANLDNAYKAFFRGTGKFPKFQSRHARKSCAFMQGCRVDATNKLILPKVGAVRAVIHRPVDGRIIRTTISMSPSGKYYASVLAEVADDNRILPLSEKAVGIDLGVNNLVTLFDSAVGSAINVPGLIANGKSASLKEKLESVEQKIKKVQKHLSRKQENRKKDKQGQSRRQEKCRIRLARLRERAAQIRENFQGELSSFLVNEYSTICLEDLRVKNMSRSAKGTIERPGKNVKRKAGLNREILKACFGSFRQKIEYKSAQRGRRMIINDQWLASSKNCSSCGMRNRSLGAKRRWTCSNCGTAHDRDQNAAKNILDAGLIKASSEVLAEYSRRAEKNSREKKPVKKVSDEAITSQTSARKKQGKPSVVSITADASVNTC